MELTARRLTDIYICLMLAAFPLWTGFEGYTGITRAKFLFFAALTGLWLAALWAPLSALLLVYGVLAKYAVYDPTAPEAAASTASMLGLAGFIVWPLLPVTLAMLVSHALRAERNLNRYLYDYD